MADIRIKDLPLATGGTAPVGADFVAIDGLTTRRTTITALGNVAVPIASQATAEAGVNATERMVPLTVKQSIASEVGVTIASATDGLLAETALQPGDAATPAQGAKADSAVQPATLAIVAPAISANTMLVDNAAGSERESKNALAVNAFLNPLRDFFANGVGNDSANFTALEAIYSGHVVDLDNKIYLVTAIPTGNMYVNGFWKIGSLTYDAVEWSSFIASSSDTGGIEPDYTGGTLPLLAPSGRSTPKTIGLLWSQNSRSEFVRAVNVGSIYCWAKGNVSGCYSARNCLSWVPQSVNIASEECWVWGGFRGANIASFTSGCENESNFNLGTRGSFATGRNSGNVATTGARAGRGGGIRLTVTPVAGVINTAAITINQPGSRYQVGDSLVFFDRSGSPSTVAIATITSIDANGGATAVTVSTNGIGYSARVDATVDNGTGDFSANVACSGFTETIGEASAVIASLGGSTSYVKASGDRSAAIACENGSEASGNLSIVMASTAGIASGQISAVIVGNNCQSTAQESLATGRRTVNPTTREWAGGDAASGAALSSNRKWSLSNATGLFKSVLATSVGTFSDMAEYFPNITGAEIPVGTIVQINGEGVEPWDGKYPIAGVISATAAFIAGDSHFSWASRYLYDEFGRPIMVDGIDEDTGETVKVQAENPDYDPSIPNVPRSERPSEWSLVGVLGQVFTMVSKTTRKNDMIGGRLQVMKITTPWDDEKGYAVAKCFIM